MTQVSSAEQHARTADDGDGLVASVIISTYNRHDVLGTTLEALSQQDISPARYEVVVVDDGSTDKTQKILGSFEVPYALQVHRFPVNRGVSAGRNAGMLAAKGRNLILLSDDLVVSQNFISAHVRTLDAHPDSWVVGGFSQRESLTGTPFGRYLDVLERRFEKARTGPQLAPGLFLMHAPTARNLSLPRSDIERVGLFDERFRVTCEDQDLAHRAQAHGIRFLYNAEITCVHNDHAASLRRYCDFQERGAVDTVRLCRKYPEIHGQAALATVNGRVRHSDGAWLNAKKLVKLAMASRAAIDTLERLVEVAERTSLPDRVIFRAYKAITGVYIFRGWRTGLREKPSPEHNQSP